MPYYSPTFGECRAGNGADLGNFVTAETMAKGIWNRSHYLDRMTLKELWVAYFQYPAIIAYIALAAVSVAVWALYPATALQTLGIKVQPIYVQATNTDSRAAFGDRSTTFRIRATGKTGSVTKNLDAVVTFDRRAGALAQDLGRVV